MSYNFFNTEFNLASSYSSFKDIAPKTVIDSEVILEGKYKGTFNNPSLKEVLDGVALASGFKYRIENENKIIINMK